MFKRKYTILSLLFLVLMLGASSCASQRPTRYKPPKKGKRKPCNCKKVKGYRGARGRTAYIFNAEKYADRNLFFIA